ncbi:glutamine--fructose-6-phosphate transaminase (isomerizing) [Candidatus Uhrbacteria bacterium]|nr:glutamine--fructose-6-phosphate transaminase (isomerizing) [Candidatus Uhrbacteria bacterium]
MCGIVGYIGKQPALPILLQGLRRLEYRGYDSAGVAILESRKQNLEYSSPVLERVRSVGRIDALDERVRQGGKLTGGTLGIAHTRWATHGWITEENAHPHTDCTGDLMLVHNGIIENYREIRARLGERHALQSKTDSEILAHLIETHYKGDLRAAVSSALQHACGTYGLAVMHRAHPDEIVAARLGSPLVIGVGDGEHFIASDATPMLPYTKRVIFLNDGEIATVFRDRLPVVNLKSAIVDKHIEELDWNDEQAQKQGYPHFMLKEIFDQPTVLKDAIRGRFNMEEGAAHLGGLNMSEDEMRAVKRVSLIACGTASYAAMVGKYAFERLAGIPAEIDVGSEFRYRDPIVDQHTLVFAVSQSGETADTLAALREAKRKGAYVRGIVNVIGSTIARESDGGTYIHAGPEIAVASTKAYTNMVAVLLLYALQFGRLRRVTVATGQRLLQAITKAPGQIETILSRGGDIERIAQKYKGIEHALYLGRGINFPVALEGSLKLKEISYIHSEAYPGGEMKHGPIALLSKNFPVVAIATQDQMYSKMCSNIEEIRSRRAPVIIVATEGDVWARELSEDVIYVPPTMELTAPLINTIPLQLLAYYMAALLGRDVDRPRNLAKSVTVE